ncbi:hypothetical protein GAY33_10750 [Azospirillum brasilense]|uniref:hypothetical protein n=1 Tax=Azospirillum argentinense TaxID=2970906 RepID=UPI0019093AAA|nr:hypothetical protein [Azospirillum argentinense]MBK3799704.1 hypothetical protein [Azospirillum argentinense]
MRCPVCGAPFRHQVSDVVCRECGSFIGDPPKLNASFAGLPTMPKTPSVLDGISPSLLDSMRKAGSLAAGLPTMPKTPSVLDGISPSLLDSMRKAGSLAAGLQTAYSGAALFGDYGRSADLTRSVWAMAELSAIGHALHTTPPFDPTFTEMLRADLGDWRKVKALPKRIFEDPIARLTFYEDRGLNTALTDFSAVTFNEALVVTGIRSQIEPEDEIAESDGSASPSVDDILVAPATNVTAYGYLFAFERQIRLLIAIELEALDGPEWFKKRVHPEMLRRWEEKKATDQKHGVPDHPLIEYADFTDYLPIIEQKNNWREAFERIFVHKPSLQESFRRLYPLRLSAMHARTLIQADQMYVYVEVHRLLTAMRKVERV